MSNSKVSSQSNWSAVPVEAALESFKTSSEGLNEEEVARRLAQYGPNLLPRGKRRSALIRFLAQFHNVIIYVLLASSAGAALLSDWLDAGVILAAVIINATIGFIQEGKAEQAMDAVRNMLSLHATVTRDGRRQVVEGESIVPGDIVFVQSGDKIPADMRLVRVKSLQVQEAALTGESVPVSKDVCPVPADALLGDRASMAYSGTVVTYGQGTGVVVATGAATELGRISAMLSEVGEMTTPLLEQMGVFGRWWTVVIIAVAASVFAMGMGIWSLPASDMFMAAVGVAVAAIPEGLPAVITVTLAIGVQRMAKRRAIIRRLPAVETLGAVTTICSDKTGTLTRNELTVRAVVTANSIYETSGSGYDPRGAFTRYGREVSLDEATDLLEVTRAIALCNDSSIRETDGVWSIDGDPTEGALLTAAMKGGLDLRKAQQALPRTDAIPFESQHRFMATLHHDHLGHGFIFVKGAPERLLDMCASQRDGDNEKRALDRDTWLTRIDEIAAKGQRVLGVAVKYTVADHCELTFGDVETGLIFLGLIGLIDPPREETLEAVRQCVAAGIGIKMITGDHAATAAAIGRELGLENAGAALTGRDIDALSDEELSGAASSATIFARTSPEHKLRLVKTLQGQGQIVAMTGDGVNDAPALKRADIGIAMGVKGTEAAKEAAEMVLADDNFASIVQAVHEGRVVYDNLRKCIMYMLAISSGQALTIVAAVAFGEALPITPIQILWVNLVDSVTLGLALAFEAAEPNIMDRPPRSPKEPIVSRYLLGRTAFVSVMVLVATFGLYELETMHGADVETARTVAVNTLVACGIGYIFSVRRLVASSISWDGFFGSRPVLIAVGLIVVFQALFTYAPWLQTLFGTSGLGLRSWLSILAAGAAVFAVAELEKAARRHKDRTESKARPVAKGSVLADILGAFALLLVAGGWLYHSVMNSPTIVSATGVVRPVADKAMAVTAQASGVVQSVYCDPGMKVAKGQLCAKLDPGPFDDVVKREKDALAAAEATLARNKTSFATAEAGLDRNTTLSKRRAVSRKALDASRRAVAQAQGRVRQAGAAVAERREALAAAEAALGKIDVLAPSEGIIVARNIEAGQMIATDVATPLFLLATDLANVRVAIEVAGNEAGKIEVGDAANITAALLPGKKFPAVVSGIRRAEADKNGVNYEVAVDAANPDQLLKPGMTANVKIDVEARDALTR